MTKQLQHQKASQKGYSQRLCELVILLFVCLLGGYFLSSCTSQIQEKPERESAFKPLIPDVPVDEMSDVNFTTFKHDKRHQTIPCLLCHQRTEDSAKPKFSSHTPCAGCHTQQFKDKSHPICVICHTNVETGELKEFPPMKSFKMEFNHTAHFKEANCATCHQPQGGGISIPARLNAHATCFQCHTSDKIVGEKNLGSCSTCHQPGTPNPITDSAKTVGFNFEHAKHSGLNCQSCHTPTSSNQMSAINVSMHSGQTNSCRTCHNGGKAFGATDFKDCRRCHQEVAKARSFGVKFDHANHTKSNCATCHKAGGQGVNFTVPNGQNAHNTCFQCHSPMKGGGSFTNSKCFTCHQIGGTNNISAPPVTIAGNFSHTRHNGLDCRNCHTSSGGEMSAPTVAMHTPAKLGLSCATCHNNQKAFGEDFSNCKRCHTNNSFKF